MYKKIEPPLRMTKNEVYERYPNDFILTKADSVNMSSDMETVFYVGDNYIELFSLAMTFQGPDDIIDNKSRWGVLEGLHHQLSLGGIVVGT